MFTILVECDAYLYLPYQPLPLKKVPNDSLQRLYVRLSLVYHKQFLTIKLKRSSNLTASTSFCKSLNHSVSIQLVFVGVTPERGLIPFTEANGVLYELWESLGLGGSFLDNFLLWISWEGADYPGGGGGVGRMRSEKPGRPRYSLLIKLPIFLLFLTFHPPSFNSGCFREI